MEFYNNDYLMHYGVKGMKWGVRRYRNEDGSLTDAGKRRQVEKFARDYYSQTKKDGNARNANIKLSKTKVISDLYSREELKKARERINAVRKVEDDYYNNNELKEKYQRITAKELSKYGPYTYDKALSIVQYDDSNRDGHYNSFSTYLYKTGKGESYNKEIREAHRNYNEIVRKVVDEYLGEYGDISVKTARPGRNASPDETTVAELIDRAVHIRSIYEE